MKKQPQPLPARQASEIAIVNRNNCWYPKNRSWLVSRSFKTKDAAVKAALNAGYGVVMYYNGTILARKV